jgi:hypothetical protein
MYVNQWPCHSSSAIGPNPTVTLRSKWKVLGITLLSKITDFERLLPGGRRSIVVVVRSGGYTFVERALLCRNFGLRYVKAFD